MVVVLKGIVTKFVVPSFLHDVGCEREDLFVVVAVAICGPGESSLDGTGGDFDLWFPARAVPGTVVPCGYGAGVAPWAFWFFRGVAGSSSESVV